MVICDWNKFRLMQFISGRNLNGINASFKHSYMAYEEYFSVCLKCFYSFRALTFVEVQGSTPNLVFRCIRRDFSV